MPDNLLTSVYTDLLARSLTVDAKEYLTEMRQSDPTVDDSLSAACNLAISWCNELVPDQLIAAINETYKPKG